MSWYSSELSYTSVTGVFSLPSLPSDVKKVTAIPLHISDHIHQPFLSYEQHFNTYICLEAFPPLTPLFSSGLVPPQIAHYLQSRHQIRAALSNFF